MLTRLCITVIAVAVVVGGSVSGQSLLLNRGEYGVFFQGGYITTKNLHGGESGIGYAKSDYLDIGMSVSRFETQTYFGPFLDIYLLRFGGERVNIAWGLHESATFEVNSGGEGALSFGSSMNLVARTSSKTGIVLSGGVFIASFGALDETFMSGLIAVNPFIRVGTGKLASIMFEYSVDDGPDTYVVGLSWSFNWGGD